MAHPVYEWSACVSFFLTFIKQVKQQYVIIINIGDVRRIIAMFNFLLSHVVSPIIHSLCSCNLTDLFLGLFLDLNAVVS